MLLCIVYALLFVDSVGIYRENFWGGSLLHCVENVSTVLTYIPLNALEILMPSVNSVDIYSIDGMVEKPSVSAFQNFYGLKIG